MHHNILDMQRLLIRLSLISHVARVTQFAWPVTAQGFFNFPWPSFGFSLPQTHQTGLAPPMATAFPVFYPLPNLAKVWFVVRFTPTFRQTLAPIWTGS